MYRKKALSFREVGQGLVEYALILALVSIVSMLALSALGVNVRGVFEQVTCAIRGEEEDCDLPVPEEGGGGPCKNEKLTGGMACYGGNVLAVGYASDCPDTDGLDLVGHGALTWEPLVSMHLGYFTGVAACSGRPENSSPNGTFTIVAHRNDGSYKNITVDP